MALSRTDVTSQNSASNHGTGTWTSTSIDPPDNTLLVACVTAIENAGTTDPSGDISITDSLGLTWTARQNNGGDPGAGWSNGCRFFTAPYTSGSLTITLDCAARNIYRYCLAVVAYTGHDASTPVGATGGSNTVADDGPRSFELSASPAAGSEVLGLLSCDTGTGCTPGTGWTEVYDNTTLGDGGLHLQARAATLPAAAEFGALGTKSAGGTSTISVAYPSGIAAEDMILAGRAGWLDTITFTDESGWTNTAGLAGGTGTAADNHTTEVRVDRLEATGSESGSVTFDQGGTISGCLGVMARYTKGDPDATWSVATATGTDDTHGANRSVTASGNIAFAVGDVLIAVCATDTDTNLAGFASPALTASGITFGTTTRRTTGAGVVTGVDGNIEVFDATVTAGSGTVAPALSFTTTTSQCGPVAFVRLRPSQNTAYDATVAWADVGTGGATFGTFVSGIEIKEDTGAPSGHPTHRRWESVPFMRLGKGGQF